MAPSSTLIITLIVINSLHQAYAAATGEDSYNENLFLKPLSDGKLLAHFQFKTLYRDNIKNLRWENKMQIFPLDMAHIVALTDIHKLHFSLTKGNWNYRDWGYPARSSPPGAQIRVQFSPHNENPQRSWKRLVNSLSGIFCASLASADDKTLVASKLAFCSASAPPNSTDHVLYASLPEETLCTENLTPWKKLLPCHSKSGLASLLNAANLFKSSYSSLALDMEPVPCMDIPATSNCEQVQLTQSITVVFNLLNMFEGKQAWSLMKIFGNQIQGTCPIASSSLIHVDITDLDDKAKLYPTSYFESMLELSLADNSRTKRNYAVFDVHSIISASLQSNATSQQKRGQMNVGIKQMQLFKKPPLSSRPRLPVYLSTHVAGHGTGEGNIVATIYNELDKQVRVTYMDSVPYFLRVYLHTLTIRLAKSNQEIKPDRLNFVLSENSSPTLIEFSMIVPGRSEIQISYDFERAFLRWSEYKPAAHKGMLLGSTAIGVSTCTVAQFLALPIKLPSPRYLNSSSLSTPDCSSSQRDDMVVVYARPLLIILPLPDFSMPYNVITIVCTVMVGAIGPIYSLTTSKPLKKVENEGDDKDKADEAQTSESKKDE